MARKQKQKAGAFGQSAGQKRTNKKARAAKTQKEQA